MGRHVVVGKGPVGSTLAEQPVSSRPATMSTAPVMIRLRFAALRRISSK